MKEAVGGLRVGDAAGAQLARASGAAAGSACQRLANDPYVRLYMMQRCQSHYAVRKAELASPQRTADTGPLEALRLLSEALPPVPGSRVRIAVDCRSGWNRRMTALTVETPREPHVSLFFALASSAPMQSRMQPNSRQIRACTALPRHNYLGSGPCA